MCCFARLILVLLFCVVGLLLLLLGIRGLGATTGL